MTALPEAQVPSGGMAAHAWESQVPQYPSSGPPGISYYLGVVNIGDITGSGGTTVGRVKYEVDNLLYRSRKGTLIGILQYFPEDAPMDLEKAGNLNVWVHPRRQRRGIGTALLREAERRWGPLNLGQQNYTPEGRALASAFLDREGDRP